MLEFQPIRCFYRLALVRSDFEELGIQPIRSFLDVLLIQSASSVLAVLLITFFVIGLSCKHVQRYAVVARHMFSGWACHPIQFFSARNRATQAFSLFDYCAVRLLMLTAQSIRFSLFSFLTNVVPSC